MDIYQMSDKDILNYLLSSNYEENFTEDEYKYLLTKFKRYFRNSELKNEQSTRLIDNIRKENKDEILRREVEYNKNLKLIEELNRKIENLSYRKLTLKERIKGVIYNTDKDKE